MDTSEVRTQHRFNEQNLHKYLMQNVPEFPKTPGKLQIRQYRSGQSNPTFYLQKDGCELVMRKKPPGKLLRGAHQVKREYQVQVALHKVGFPVPRPVIYCDDTSIIGTDFYVMQHVRGRIFRDISLPDMSPSERRDIYEAMNATLAQMHNLDYRAIGLERYGAVKNYPKRQLLTWTKQYEGAAKLAKLPAIPNADMLIRWLQENIPAEEQRTTVVHGDYRLENMIFHPTEPRVIAVLDWELSTLGDPLCDLAYLCMPYNWPKEFASSPVNPAAASGSIISEIDGVPSQEEFLQAYCHRTGIRYPVPNWEFYLALAFFKICSICQGVYSRGIMGNASSDMAQMYGEVTKQYAEVGYHITKRSNHSITMASASQSVTSVLDSGPSTARGREIYQKVKDFMRDYVYPAESVYEKQLNDSPTCWCVPPIMEELKAKAKAAGLWNLFLPGESGLGQLDYAFMAEEMGRSPIASEVFNCSAPDTGNMEVLHLYGNAEQKEKWLKPLLNGDIRSCFCMTEPQVASSDATNMELTIDRVGNEYVVTGRKWWSSGAGDPRCKIAIVMGKVKTAGDFAPRHKQHSMILVPMDLPGVKKVRPLQVFGNVDAPHGHYEMEFDHVRVPLGNMILGEGRGFEIAQGRLGPGRIHHCMRAIGLAERALSMLCDRAFKREAFKRKLAMMGVVQHQIAESRIEIEQARLLTLQAAYLIDKYGTKRARKHVAMIKVAAPRMMCKVIDRAIQIHGGAGVCQDFPLARMYAGARTLRLADGPDEVHLTSIALQELKHQMSLSKL